MDSAKRDFGSFHASNVQELVEIREEQYEHPEFPVSLPVFKENLVFGNEARRSYFYLEDGCTFLNHGAFGCTLKPALEVSQALQVYCERQPLRFMDRLLLPLLASVTRRLSTAIGCSPRDLALVPNATTGTSSVLSSLPLKPGDTVFYLNCCYGAVKKLLKQVAETKDLKLQEENVTYPLVPNQVVEVVQQRLLKGTALAVFDHIPSNTPFIMPLEQIIPICRERGVLVFVDGAHALGSVPLDLDVLQPDYYVTNCHKWLCAPKGCGALYVRRGLQAGVHPAVKSHGLGSGFLSEFMWTGLRDYTALLSLRTVLHFWDYHGWDRIRTHNHQLLQEGAEMLKEKWKSHLAFPLSACACMALVATPPQMQESVQTICYDQAELLQNELYHRFAIEVPVKTIQGCLYVRISAHIHNYLAQYKTLCDAVLQLSAEGFLRHASNGTENAEK